MTVPIIPFSFPFSRRILVLQWSIGSFFGWGVYGLNICRHWGADDRFLPVSAHPINSGGLHETAMKDGRLRPSIMLSIMVSQALEAHNNQNLGIEMPVIHGLGNRILPSTATNGNVLFGIPTIGVIFSEDTLITPGERDVGRAYAVIVAGSTWNRDVLRANGLNNVETVLQGIDGDRFQPGPRDGRFGSDRFVVFSGGKLEFRKGQDLVLEAFRRFAARHDDALLITAWDNMWPGLAQGVVLRERLEPVPLTDDELVDIPGWLQANGLKPHQFVNLGSVPNDQMPAILHNADVAVFPNRGEGGTNLVAMEAMACGVPVILSANTGHLDLIDPSRCLPLTLQSDVGPAPGFRATDGWGESDVDEIVARLEFAYSDSAARRRLGDAAAAFMTGLSWENQIGLLKRTIDPFLPE